MSYPVDFPEPTLVPVDGAELEVFEAGERNGGMPIVLCHGWPEHVFSWRYQVPVLPRRATTSSSRTSEVMGVRPARPT